MGRRSSSDSTDSTLNKPKLGLLREGLHCSVGASGVKLEPCSCNQRDVDPHLTVQKHPEQAQAGPVAGRAALLGRSFWIEAGTLRLQPWDADPNLTLSTEPGQAPSWALLRGGLHCSAGASGLKLEPCGCNHGTQILI